MFRKSVLSAAFVSMLILVVYCVHNKVCKPAKRGQSTKELADKLTKENDLKDGDIIFQTSQSAQSRAIQLATHSPYSHCGIIFWEADHCSVREACNGVTVVPIEEFIARGKDRHFVVKRLKNKALVLATKQRMNKSFYKYWHKPYDLYFGWGDDKLYCSELVWKVYKQAAGIELGKLHHLKDFDLSNPVVQQKMKERYGIDIPWNEPVISPADIFNSNELITVKQM